MSDNLISVPSFLSTTTTSATISPRCSFCVEVACETDAMACGQCSGQSCSGQCTSAECGQCGSCERGQCSTCQSSCQGCQGCQTACEGSAQHPIASGSITVVNRSSNSITLRLGAISRATSYVAAYRPTSATAAQTVETTSLTVTVSGLEPDTTYVFNYYGKNSYGTGPYMANGVSATTLSDRPYNWAWWSTVSSGGDISLSAGEWNAFCTRINEFREYKGLAQYGAFVTARQGAEISASIVNHAVWAIGAMVSGAYSLEVRSGDTITAGFFNGLKDYLNSA